MVSPRRWALLRTACGVAVLGALTLRMGSTAVVEGIHAVDVPTALAALVIGAVTTLCVAARWCLVSRALGTPITLRTAVAESYQAQFLNSVLPAGVLGDVHRAVRRGVRAVVVERLAGQFVLVGAAVAVLVAAVLPEWPILAGAAVLAAAAVVSGRPAPAARRGRLLAGAGLAVRPEVLALSAVALAGYVATFVLAARAAGITAPVAALVPVLLVALLAMMVPLSVGGFGPRELVAAAGFGAAGFGAAPGVTAAVAYGVLGLVSCLPGAVVLALTSVRRTASRAPRAAPVPSPRTPGSAARPHPTPSTPEGPVPADTVDRRAPRPAWAA